MVKKDTFIAAVFYYCIPQFILLAAILFFAHEMIFHLFCDFLGITKANQRFYGLLGTITDAALIAAWCAFVFTTLRSKRYKKLTGRNFGYDSGQYKRSYFDLVNYFQNANPYKIDENTLPAQNWKEAEGVILGHKGERLVKRDSSGVGNLAVFGLPGSHKTTSQIIPTALRFEGSCLVIDIKGDVLHWTKEERNVKIFNPDQGDGSCHYNPFEGIDFMNISERRIFIENISNILVQDSTGKEGDNYFTSGARDFFCGIALAMLHKDITTTFPDVVYGILHRNAFDWVLDVEAGDCEEAQEYLVSYKGSNEKNVAGCYNCLAKAVRPFNSGALKELLDGQGNCISPKSLENGYDVYIEIPQDKIKIYAPITTIIVQNFMSAFMQRSDQATGEKLRPIIMLLDEFPQLHFDFDTLSQALSTLRSKSVTLFLAQQSIAQIEGRYGEAHCREIIDTCAYISFMSIQDPKSREWAQRLIGRQKVLKRGTSINSGGANASSGESVQELMEYIYEAADFGYIGPDGEDVIIYANGKYIQCQKTNCYE